MAVSKCSQIYRPTSHIDRNCQFIPMSYPLNSLTSDGAVSGQSGCYSVPPQAIRSAISSHQQQSGWIDKVHRGDKLAELQAELQAAANAFASRQMSSAEFDAVLKRAKDVCSDHSRRSADFRAREEAGQTKPADRFKEFYGYPDEEAEEYMHQGMRLMDIQRANEVRGQSRMLQPSRHGGGR